MNKIKIITDSTCDLPKHIVDKYDIEVLPLLVNIDEKTYMDNVDIKTKEFVEKMKSSKVLPTTSQITPQRFYECYKKYLEDGYDIFSIHLSSKMSGTYQSACIAKEMLDAENITVVDSLNVTSGLGVLVLKACALKENGTDLKGIEDAVKEAIPHVKSSLIFEKLDNLIKGGRLSKTAGVIGSILGIKLILQVKDGEMNVLDKVRGTKKAINTVVEHGRKYGFKKDEPLILLHIGNDEILNALKENLNNIGQEFIISEVGCVVGTHSGDDACGIFFIEDY